MWREDVGRAKSALHPGQMLVVSVVGSGQEGGTLLDLAQDFAQAAEWAAEAGADAIEANLSCPNVQSAEGSLYQSAEAVGMIAESMKARLDGVPFLLKIGSLPTYEQVLAVARAAWQGGAAGIAAINTIPAKVFDPAGRQALPGEGRLVSGICGAAIKPAGLEMVKKLGRARNELGLNSARVGNCGGRRDYDWTRCPGILRGGRGWGAKRDGGDVEPRVGSGVQAISKQSAVISCQLNFKLLV